jgi:hypothetical protein
MRMNGPNRGDSARADVAANANIAAVAGRTLQFLDRELFWVVDEGIFCPSVARAARSGPVAARQEAISPALLRACPPVIVRSEDPAARAVVGAGSWPRGSIP